MSRWSLALCLAAASAVFAQDQTTPPAQPPQQPPAGQPTLKKDRTPDKTSGKEVAPPEEDTSVAPSEFSFNPLAAKKSIEVGNYYFKTKHDYRAAANRYKEATKWNDGDSEAWLKLGEAEEKLKDPGAAKEAYNKYLELASDAKNAAEIRKKLKSLK